MRVWCNGKIVDAGGALSASDRGALLGDGLFETMAFVDGNVLRLPRHLSRLADGAELLKFPVAVEAKTIADAVASLADEIGGSEGSVRLTVLRGPGPRGVLPPSDPHLTTIISLHPGAVGGLAPVSAIIAGSTRRNECSPLSRMKTTNYGDAILARMDAEAAAADEAIMLNTRGTIAEATGANVFCVLNGTLVTPPPSDGALPGVMRAIIMENMDVSEATVSTDDLAGAEEIFLTTSLSIRPVVRLDGNVVANGTPGPVATELAGLPRSAR